MSGACKGWQDWDAFREAGVVDSHIDFTDNKVVIDNVIGKTKQTLGKSFAIDAAVAYTLSKAGPDANLTVQDMVNEYTRTASAMMNGKVGYGKPYLTGEFDGETYTSCGHDEVQLNSYSLNEVQMVGEGSEGYLTFSQRSWRNNKLNSFLLSNRAPDEVVKLSSFRLEGSTYNETVYHDGMLKHHVSMKSVILSDLMAPLREWIENHFNCTNWLLTYEQLDSKGNISGRGYTLDECSVVSQTRGKCGFSTQYCTYHNANRQVSKRDWYMVSMKNKPSEFMKVWNGSRCSSGWNSDMFYQYRSRADDGTDSHGAWYHGRTIVRWSDKRRRIANAIDEAEVKRQIKSALNRMTKRNNHVISITNGEMGDGAPEDRTYRWSDWSWLAVIQASVAQTSKKNRKENAIVNGWKYIKLSSKKSFGHEIAKFEWQVSEDVCTYVLKLKPKGSINYYNKSLTLPFRFKTLEDAVACMKFIPLIVAKNGGSGDTRQWDSSAGKNATMDVSRLTVEKVNHGADMRMKMDKDPEDLLSPATIVQNVYWGLPNEYGPSVEHLLKDHDLPKMQIIMPKTEEVLS